MLVSFFGLRVPRKGSLVALVESIELALTIVILFEAGLYFLDPGWWQIHFSNLDSFPFSLITNEDIAAAAVLALSLILVSRAVLRSLARKY